jgi:radical SAM superfamily enzyme with C-terminal helix-hairpin-helix motif
MLEQFAKLLKPSNGISITRREKLSRNAFAWKRDIAELYYRPMKERVYPSGQVLQGLHAFLLNEKGTWFRRLGSYLIMVIDPDRSIPRYEQHDLVVTGHAGRYIYGQALKATRGS